MLNATPLRKGEAQMKMQQMTSMMMPMCMCRMSMPFLAILRRAFH